MPSVEIELPFQPYAQVFFVRERWKRCEPKCPKCGHKNYDTKLISEVIGGTLIEMTVRLPNREFSYIVRAKGRSSHFTKKLFATRKEARAEMKRLQAQEK